MGRVVIAMDPHKRSATIEVMDAEENVLGGGRFGTDAHSVALVATRMVGLRPVVDLVYRHMVSDAITHATTGPGGQRGNVSDSSATGSHPHAGSSDQPLPGPATTQPTTPLRTAS
jgi:hypothetical protein